MEYVTENHLKLNHIVLQGTALDAQNSNSSKNFCKCCCNCSCCCYNCCLCLRILVFVCTCPFCKKGFLCFSDWTKISMQGVMQLLLQIGATVCLIAAVSFQLFGDRFEDLSETLFFCWPDGIRSETVRKINFQNQITVE